LLAGQSIEVADASAPVDQVDEGLGFGDDQAGRSAAWTSGARDSALAAAESPEEA
jgi:hypothetical protein